jgi:hypothetical protein
MKKQSGFTVIELVFMIVGFIGMGSWIWNAAKFASCDFESNYKCEVIHGVGIFIPPASIITVWFDDDRKKEQT